jgi:hypothetical protein
VSFGHHFVVACWLLPPLARPPPPGAHRIRTHRKSARWTAPTDKKTEILATLAEGVARLTSSDEWRAWLDVQSRFHRYSFGNTLLIALQRPDATQVAGFHAWLRLGRHVRKGERASPSWPRWSAAPE